MLEIKHISKTYKPKSGTAVKALDDVSLLFPEHGMVFVLGKSGSGKSTLLNILGGLDSADEGELLFMGRSSRDFTQSDFDCYRNTFVGFVFQEYNMLEEFTVGANVALSLQLQGKRADESAVRDILQKVDLNGFEARKPNELSGGQKQRVAIARALIKDPRIIFADEPTGALDSATGKQVLETLKKLSETKLVVVVSHDRDFAERYADRIIEMSDGRVIRDESLVSSPPQKLSEGVTAAGDKVLKISKGYRLTAADLEIINDVLAKADGDALLSADGAVSENVRQAAKMNADGGRDSFVTTDAQSVPRREYSAEESKTVRSRLPFSRSLRMGASSLKIKPFRLALTLFLCAVAFCLFGLADTMGAYDERDACVRSIIDLPVDSAAFRKTSYGENRTRSALLSEKDIDFIERNTDVDLLPVWAADLSYIGFASALDDVSAISGAMPYYTGRAAGLAEADEATLRAMGITLTGSAPASSDEVVITEYIFEHFALSGLTYTDPESGDRITVPAGEISAPEDIIGKRIEFSVGYTPLSFVITGVADTHFNGTKYARFKPNDDSFEPGIADMLAYEELTAKLTYGFHSLLFVQPGTASALEKAAAELSAVGVFPRLSMRSDLYFQSDAEQGYYRSNSISNVARLSDLTDLDAIVWTDGPRETLAEGEIILPFAIDDIFGGPVGPAVSAETKAYLSDLLGVNEEDLVGLSLTDIADRLTSFAAAEYAETDAAKTEYMSQVFQDFYARAFGGSDGEFSPEELKAAYVSYLVYDYGYSRNEFGGKAGHMLARPYLKRLAELENMGCGSLPETGSAYAGAGADDYNWNYRVVGYALPSIDWAVPVLFSDGIRDGVLPQVGTFRDAHTQAAVVCDRWADIVTADINDIFSFAVGKMPLSSRSAVKNLVNFSYDLHDGNAYPLVNDVSGTLELAGGIIKMLAQVFLYVGLFFALFGALLTFNFITVSVSHKKREIGILRAVGARSGDVFGIFFNESAIMTLISCALAVIGTFSVVAAINNALRSSYGFALTLLAVGWRQILLVFGVGILVAFVGSFLPVMRIARKRPIDAIKNL